MFQANQSAWMGDTFIKAGAVYRDDDPLVRHAPVLFDRLEDSSPPPAEKPRTVRRTRGAARG